jgi:hypothetical protein
MRRVSALFVVLAAVTAALTVAVTARSSETATAKTPPRIGGFFDGRQVFYLLTDVSSRKDARALSKATRFPVAFSPRIGRVPEGALAKLYLFMNGIRGPNPFGFQANVIDSVPGQPKYSPLWRVYAVEWSADATPRLLKSERQILQARASGDLTVTKTPLVKNSPVLP